LVPNAAQISMVALSRLFDLTKSASEERANRKGRL